MIVEGWRITLWLVWGPCGWRMRLMGDLAVWEAGRIWGAKKYQGKWTDPVDCCPEGREKPERRFGSDRDQNSRMNHYMVGGLAKIALTRTEFVRIH
jgi:hypothetical protein